MQCISVQRLSCLCTILICDLFPGNARLEPCKAEQLQSMLSTEMELVAIRGLRRAGSVRPAGTGFRD